MEKIKSFIQKVISYITAIAMIFSQLAYAAKSDRRAYPVAEDSIRVMSFNVLTLGAEENFITSRLGLVTRTIAEYMPDSFGLQEAHYGWIAWLNLTLPEYNYVGVGRDDGKYGGEFSAIYYLRAKYRVLDSGTFWLSETPDEPSYGWDADCRRVCTWAMLENKKTGEQYVHMNTHFDNAGAEARKNSVDMILAKAAEFDLPLICTGDFNFRQGSALYNKITSTGLLHDTKFLAPDTMDAPTYHGFSATPNPAVIIDFIFVNNKVSPMVYRVITEPQNSRQPSDHYPLYADVIINAD
ncbi:MAG: endonuclease/exonuclease/phosphatase family protein [Acutalibacteraceae bacterium]|jgi:endonuclease/exonuclease/phosphatase family metal-dependent hydrolase